jgi:5-methylthioribose kinase
MRPHTALLSLDDVPRYLRGRGVLTGTRIELCELGGGVSNLVVSAADGTRSVVLKQALPRLRVAGDWQAKRERALAEAAALERAWTLIPGSVPRVLDVDPDACTVTIELAPPTWSSWKGELTAGRVDETVAGRLGDLLATLHAGTREAIELDEWESFEQLRIDPYYREIARRHPALADAILALADGMAARRRCLVHGDYSPKNVLVGPSGLWIIDFEVAHRGDPTFDVAFLSTHLVLKALAYPSSGDPLLHALETFHDAYRASAPPSLVADPQYVMAHVGCLMLARVDGKSPAEYLDEPTRDRVRRLAIATIGSPPASLRGLTDAVRASA